MHYEIFHVTVNQRIHSLLVIRYHTETVIQLERTDEHNRHHNHRDIIHLNLYNHGFVIRVHHTVRMVIRVYYT